MSAPRTERVLNFYPHTHKFACANRGLHGLQANVITCLVNCAPNAYLEACTQDAVYTNVLDYITAAIGRGKDCSYLS